MLHFHVYLSRIDKSGRIKPRRIHQLILVELFSLEHGICKIQDCLAGGGIMCQLMWQIYSRTCAFFCLHALLQFRIIVSVSYIARFVLLYISELFKFNYPLANEVSESLYTCNNATVRQSATCRACENTK
jgi:hypothetical protein